MPGGSGGNETGVHPKELKIRTANKKLRNILATNKSCRNKRANNGLGRTFQAMESVTVVKIQFNSPNGVFRSLGTPGMASTASGCKFDILEGLRRTNQRSAMGMGVVKQEVKISAG